LLGSVSTGSGEKTIAGNNKNIAKSPIYGIIKP
jgi:hypothetical protein